jgi:hypothetical protein
MARPEAGPGRLPTRARRWCPEHTESRGQNDRHVTYRCPMRVGVQRCGLVVVDPPYGGCATFVDNS